MNAQSINDKPVCIARAPGDLRLLRLMARMEPVWLALAPGTAAALLRCLAKLVAERTALPRLLPWLWPLATPEARPPLSRHPAMSAYKLQSELVAGRTALPRAALALVAGHARGAPSAQ